MLSFSGFGVSSGAMYVKLRVGNEMDVSENNGTPKSSILIGISIINHPFWGTPILGNTQITNKQTQKKNPDKLPPLL